MVAPLARALRPGRPAARHPLLRPRSGPGDHPQGLARARTRSRPRRHDILRAVRAELGRDARHYNFNAYADSAPMFRYDMHTLPTEIADGIGTSTLFAAWNAAIYVAQIDDERLGAWCSARRYLDATREVLQAHGSLWFLDESYVISRKRD